MSLDNLKKNQIEDPFADDADSGSSGQGSAIGFKDFMEQAPSRDDQLPPSEKRRLMNIHKDSHEDRVKKEKELKEVRKALKEGEKSLQEYRQENERVSQFKENPILAQSAQFSSADTKVTALPTENTADTNPENREELELQLRLRNRPEAAPRFNPKPSFNR